MRWPICAIVIVKNLIIYLLKKIKRKRCVFVCMSLGNQIRTMCCDNVCYTIVAYTRNLSVGERLLLESTIIIAIDNTTRWKRQTRIRTRQHIYKLWCQRNYSMESRVRIRCARITHAACRYNTKQQLVYRFSWVGESLRVFHYCHASCSCGRVWQ